MLAWLLAIVLVVAIGLGVLAVAAAIGVGEGLNPDAVFSLISDPRSSPLVSSPTWIGVTIALNELTILGLVASVVGELRPEWLVAVLLASACAVVVGGYFVLFWTTAGQTPGMRLMRLRVVARASGGPPRLGRALLRLLGLGLAIVPLFAGFLPVLFTERRRGLQDFFGDTVVVHAERPPLPTEGVEIRGEPARELMSRA